MKQKRVDELFSKRQGTSNASLDVAISYSLKITAGLDAPPVQAVQPQKQRKQRKQLACGHEQHAEDKGDPIQQQQRKRKADPEPSRLLKENQEPNQQERAIHDGSGAAAGTSGERQAFAPLKRSMQGSGREAAAQASRQGSGPARRVQQSFLDLGQRDFNASRCSMCGMVYARGQEEDEKLHRSYCAAGSQGVKFQGWTCERVLLSDAFKGRLLMVLPSDPASHIKKVQEVCSLVERLHCLTPGWLLGAQQWKVFLYVSTQRRVVGLLVAEPLRQAYRVMPAVQPSTAAGGAGAEVESQQPAQAAAQQDAAPGTQQQQQQQQEQEGQGMAEAPPEKRGIWRGLHGRHLRYGGGGGLSGGSSLGSGGTGHTAARGADSCPSALLRVAQNLALASPGTTLTSGLQQQQQRPPPAAGAGGPAAIGGGASGSGAAGGAPAIGGAPGRLAIDRSRPARAAVGIRMVWVSAEQRRQGVATRLLDAARGSMVQCYVAPRAQLAFTQPTEAGAALAAAYVGAPSWLIYGV